MKKGIAASKGYSIGKVFVQEHDEIAINDTMIGVADIVAEKVKMQKAIDDSRMQLKVIKDEAEKEIGAEKAAVFEAHITLLDDPKFIGAMMSEIQNTRVNGLKAIEIVANTFIAIFESMDNEYMRERAADIKYVSKRILSNFAGKGGDAFAITENNTVVVAHDLTS